MYDLVYDDQTLSVFSDREQCAQNWSGYLPKALMDTNDLWTMSAAALIVSIPA